MKLGSEWESQMEAITKPQKSVDTEFGEWGAKNDYKAFTQK